MSYLNIADIRLCTESEGPGKRVAVWVQGCLANCPNCCNPEMQNIKEKHIVDVIDLMKIIKSASKQNNIEGITVLGGEPFLQSEGVCELVALCKKNGLNVIVFTGFLYDELKNSSDKYILEILKTIDVLVDGPFIESEIDDERQWIGSKNQKIYIFSNVYKERDFYNDSRSMDIYISEEKIFVNGWPYKE